MVKYNKYLNSFENLKSVLIEDSQFKESRECYRLFLSNSYDELVKNISIISTYNEFFNNKNFLY